MADANSLQNLQRLAGSESELAGQGLANRNKSEAKFIDYAKKHAQNYLSNEVLSAEHSIPGTWNTNKNQSPRRTAYSQLDRVDDSALNTSAHKKRFISL